MFNDLRPYEEYREIGLPWLEAVPAHWSVKRAKNIVRPVDVRSTDGHEELLTVSSARGVVPRSSATVSMFQATSYVGHKLCWPGDLVINSLWAWGRGLGVSRFHGIVSTAYGVYRPRGAQPIEAKYLDLLARSDAFQWELQVRSRGVWKSRLQLTDDQFLDAPLTVPPAAEQAAIVKYLAHAHARIDRAIAAKRRLIALLEEQKQAIINQAVTRGLDPTAPFKDTGIPWLGHVPAHWDVAALRHRYSQVLGKMLDSGRITGEHSLPYLRNVDVQWERINAADLPHMDIPESEYERYTVEPGDLLVCEGGEVGRSAIWSGSGRVGFQKALHRLRPVDRHRDAPKYLLCAMKAAVSLAAFSDGHVSTIAHLTGEKLRAHRFAWPPADEQLAIVAYIEIETATADAAIERTHREIELLREFRTRLTSDVVTGQVDVRNIAASLPELDPVEAIVDVNDAAEDLVDEVHGLLEDIGA